MKSIVVASAFVLAASAIAVPFTEKHSGSGPKSPVKVQVSAPPHQLPEMKPSTKWAPRHEPAPPFNKPAVHAHVPTPFYQKQGSDHASKQAGKPKKAATNKPSNDNFATVDGEVAVDRNMHRRGKPTTEEFDSMDRPANETTTDGAGTPDTHSHDSTMMYTTEDPATNGTMTSNPMMRRDAPTDIQILQYALTLEHLENAFYDGALKKFNNKAFAKAGLPPFARERFEQIAAHEAEHVNFLTTALASNAVAACNYNFPYHDPKSFAALSMVLEGVGVSAYLGAAQFIQDKGYLTAAGAILTTESRHAAWVASTINKLSPWSGPLDTPLGLDQVFSLAAQFITSCPPNNAALPLRAFPTLTIKNRKYGAGDVITLEFDASSANGQPTYLAIYSGLDTYYSPIENNKAKLPEGLEGTSYGLVSTSNSAVTDQNTVAGMAVFEFYEEYYKY
ncbi:hypothetical protein FRB98_001631 [Tulasnella sp. 332]|nr:hypothetical protein FRB98_001631 [Tulasnella sp. 332]